jgi:hypothetical protein
MRCSSFGSYIEKLRCDSVIKQTSLFDDGGEFRDRFGCFAVDARIAVAVAAGRAGVLLADNDVVGACCSDSRFLSFNSEISFSS